MRLILVPQYPSSMRYQSWWFEELPKHFRKYFDEVIVLGEKIVENPGAVKYNSKMFSPINQAIYFEQIQIQEFMKMDLREDDRLLVCDISFPGFFVNCLYHKPMKHAFAICHASAKNAYDYWQPVRRQKWKNECAHAKLFKKIFVATNFHKEKLGWNNTIVTALPFPPMKTFKEKKTRDIISVARPCIQKVNKKLEKKIEKEFSRIIRMIWETWEGYYKFVSTSRVMIVSSRIETFGYQIVDAILNNTIPIAPNKYSYPELLPSDYLYDNYDDLRYKLMAALEGTLRVPKLLNEKTIKNFYKNVADIMKG